MDRQTELVNAGYEEAIMNCEIPETYHRTLRVQLQGTDSPYRSEEWSFVISRFKSENEKAAWLSFVNGRPSSLRQPFPQMLLG